jgi:hypothetical protein
MPVEIEFPSDEEWAELIAESLKESVDAALSVAEDLGSIIRTTAFADNQDVDGNQMAKKKPRPKGTPANFPEIALIQNDTPDLMNPDRWSVERTGPYEATVTYTPPDHFWRLQERPADAGGRTWLTAEKINPNAEKDIEYEMARRGEQ